MPSVRKHTDWEIYKRIAGYLHGMRWHFAVAVVGYVIVAAAEGFFAQTIGAVVHVFESPNINEPAADGARVAWFLNILEGVPLSSVYLFPILIIGAALVRGFGTIAATYLLSRVSFHVVHSVRCDLYEHLLVLPSSFFDRNKQGSLSNRLTDTTSKLRDTTTDVLTIAIQDTAKIIVLFGYMLYISVTLTLVFVPVVLVVGIVVRLAARRFRLISRRIQTSMGEVTHIGQETVVAHHVIRAYGGEEYERERFVQASNANRGQHLKMVVAKTMSTQLIQVFVAIAIGLLVGILFLPMFSGTMSSAGDLVTYVLIAGLMANPTKRLSDMNARLQTGLAAAEEIFEQIDSEPERDSGDRELARSQGRIDFNAVSFGYETKDENAVTDVSFGINPGETVALVGLSGAGKTTLAKLLMRFYEPTSGEILLDGHSIDEYVKRDLRRQIAYVGQDMVLFNDTLRANIAYGELADASPLEIRRACDHAHVTEFLDRMPLGLETHVGDRGGQVSLGQRQRITIARAFLKNAPILILDEATSSLDTESEALVHDALDDVMKDRTTLVIAHRLSTVENADRIVVLDRGRVVEQGHHTQLLALNGRYATLFRSQFQSQDTGHVAESEAKPPAPVVRRVDDPASMLVRAWYTDQKWLRSLAPLSWTFSRLAERRRREFLTGRRSQWRAPVPVIIVGNITVGGTGKTPLVMWLARWLANRGRKVGIVSRGYGGRANYPLFVDSRTDISKAGDEAPMLAGRTGCPVVVDPDRVRAVKTLLDNYPVDVVLADDGMQHYALERDIEIAVLDGTRGVGNGKLLPQGPLREPVDRLQSVDWVVCNGNSTGLVRNESIMKTVPSDFVNISTGERVPAWDFHRQVDGSIYAFAAIGNPRRFEKTLTDLQLSPIIREFPDHYDFSESDHRVESDASVIVTEKDARRVPATGWKPGQVWYLEIEVEFDSSEDGRLAAICSDHELELSVAS